MLCAVGEEWSTAHRPLSGPDEHKLKDLIGGHAFRRVRIELRSRQRGLCIVEGAWLCTSTPTKGLPPKSGASPFDLKMGFGGQKNVCG